MIAQGTNGSVELYEHHIVIQRRGVSNAVRGLRGDKSIPLASITAIQFRPAGFFNKGRIAFSLLGGREFRSLFRDETTDENIVIFSGWQQPAFEQLKDAIQKAINIPSLASIATQYARPRDTTTPHVEAPTNDGFANLRQLDEPHGRTIGSSSALNANATKPPERRDFGLWWRERGFLSKTLVVGAGGFLLLLTMVGLTNDDSTVSSAGNAEESAQSALAAMTPDEQQKAAFAVAFDEKEAPHFNPVALINVGIHKALIAVRRTPVNVSHADAGALAVRYVDWNSTDFAATGVVPILEETGSYGQIVGWKVRRDLAKNPIVVLEGGGTWTGCTVSWATLIELAPSRPATLANMPVYYEFPSFDPGGDGGQFTGTISKSRNGIKVRYSGTVNTTVHLVRTGGELKPDRAPPKTC